MKHIIKINQANFTSEVLNAPQPVIVNFWAEWCSQCKMLTPLLNEIATEYAGRVKIARVNVEENPSLAGQHHIESTPTLIYFINGLVQDQLVGIQGKRAILSKLEVLSFAA